RVRRRAPRSSSEAPYRGHGLRMRSAVSRRRFCSWACPFPNEADNRRSDVVSMVLVLALTTFVARSGARAEDRPPTVSVAITVVPIGQIDSQVTASVCRVVDSTFRRGCRVAPAISVPNDAFERARRQYSAETV